VPPLEPGAAEKLRDETPLWKLESSATRLARAFEFADFREAMRFVNRVAEVAEAEGHHPDIAIHWNKVNLVLWTHKIGGLHENDFIVAAKIDRLLEEPSRPSGAVLAG
jgi:4a-hydroxytetrahydrobiopterin dehydratase